METVTTTPARVMNAAEFEATLTVLRQKLSLAINEKIGMAREDPWLARIYYRHEACLTIVRNKLAQLMDQENLELELQTSIDSVLDTFVESEAARLYEKFKQA